MKYFAILTLFVVIAIGCAAAYDPDEDDSEIARLGEVCYRYLQDVEIRELFILCLAHGQEFNGHKTCEVGCRLICMQPGCGGFARCSQIPNNARLHKYKCHCRWP